MRMVVVLPEPLGPRKPKTEPRGTARSTPSTASWWPNRLLRPRGLNGELRRPRPRGSHLRGSGGLQPLQGNRAGEDAAVIGEQDIQQRRGDRPAAGHGNSGLRSSGSFSSGRSTATRPSADAGRAGKFDHGFPAGAGHRRGPAGRSRRSGPCPARPVHPSRSRRRPCRSPGLAWRSRRRQRQFLDRGARRRAEVEEGSVRRLERQAGERRPEGRLLPVRGPRISTLSGRPFSPSTAMATESTSVPSDRGVSTRL